MTPPPRHPPPPPPPHPTTSSPPLRSSRRFGALSRLREVLAEVGGDWAKLIAHDSIMCVLVTVADYERMLSLSGATVYLIMSELVECGGALM